MRHSGSRSCHVETGTPHEGRLVRITDTGTGVAPDARPGVGTSSMRERAEELGGSCTATSGASGGTVVVARLPTPAVSVSLGPNASTAPVPDEKVLP